jgi:hypothetical protein
MQRTDRFDPSAKLRLASWPVQSLGARDITCNLHQMFAREKGEVSAVGDILVRRVSEVLRPSRRPSSPSNASSARNIYFRDSLGSFLLDKTFEDWILGLWTVEGRVRVGSHYGDSVRFSRLKLSVPDPHTRQQRSCRRARPQIISPNA